jgi:hypothetical protein
MERSARIRDFRGNHRGGPLHVRHFQGEGLQTIIIWTSGPLCTLTFAVDLDPVTTKRAKRATSGAPTERWVSAERLIARIEALQRDVDALKRRIASPEPGCVTMPEMSPTNGRERRREARRGWLSHACSAQDGKLMGFSAKVSAPSSMANRRNARAFVTGWGCRRARTRGTDDVLRYSER